MSGLSTALNCVMIHHSGTGEILQTGHFQGLNCEETQPESVFCSNVHPSRLKLHRKTSKSFNDESRVADEGSVEFFLTQDEVGR